MSQPSPLDEAPTYCPGEPMTEPLPLVTRHDPDEVPVTIDCPSEDESIPDTLRMITPEDAARANLNALAVALGRDEVRVLARIAERLLVGRRVYGPLMLATDRRSFRKEAREEVEDALVYLACEWLRGSAQEGTR